MVKKQEEDGGNKKRRRFWLYALVGSIAGVFLIIFTHYMIFNPSFRLGEFSSGRVRTAADSKDNSWEYSREVQKNVELSLGLYNPTGRPELALGPIQWETEGGIGGSSYNETWKIWGGGNNPFDDESCHTSSCTYLDESGGATYWEFDEGDRGLQKNVISGSSTARKDNVIVEGPPERLSRLVFRVGRNGFVDILWLPEGATFGYHSHFVNGGVVAPNTWHVKGNY